MNTKQLREAGVPESCIPSAVEAVAKGAKSGLFADRTPQEIVAEIVRAPEVYVGHRVFDVLARNLVEHQSEAIPGKKGSIGFRQWGEEIDEPSKQQMREACSLPVSVAGALMPDAHVGYGLPIGGVLATENAIIPYAVGVDIACRMKLSITDLPIESFEGASRRLDEPLVKGTRFGVGGHWRNRQQHEVMDRDWNVAPLTAELKNLAWDQLGTSGSGNHFVEWGELTLHHAELGLEPGRYVALLSHSGSRGAGARTCKYYSTLAEKLLPKRYLEMRRLAWLSLDREEGAQYYAAMNLMGEYAAANHAVIHRNVLDRAGAQALAGVENHHNFAWKENHGGNEVMVHRKGATPAREGVLGVIPGSMADAAFLVRGKGNKESLDSASHGAGRRMSRTEARKQFTWKQWKPILEKRGVRLLGGGLDEVPGAYKDIRSVMAAQQDLVDVLATFEPKVVLMCNDGSRAED
jgi:tRNA-splicing ligase RtcB (3'-phosphate/5'-hydroxy nucleic acid ligase)